MARLQLKAQFFVTPHGEILHKAPPLKDKEKSVIYERDGKVCAFCKKEVMRGGVYSWSSDYISAGHIDHIKPRSRGGQNNTSNLRVLCHNCNVSRGADI